MARSRVLLLINKGSEQEPVETVAAEPNVAALICNKGLPALFAFAMSTVLFCTSAGSTSRKNDERNKEMPYLRPRRISSWACVYLQSQVSAVSVDKRG
jgi:hypothetical protein